MPRDLKTHTLFQEVGTVRSSNDFTQASNSSLDEVACLAVPRRDGNFSFFQNPALHFTVIGSVQIYYNERNESIKLFFFLFKLKSRTRKTNT
jgi:hypothetical protein